MSEDPSNPATEEPAAPAKKRPSKLVVIIVASLVALGAAGGGAYYFLGHSDQLDADAENADSEKDAKSNVKSKSKKEQKPKGPSLYIKLDPPFVSNFESKGMVRFLQVNIEVMTREQATVDLIKLHDPLIRNDLLLLLGSQTYEAISSREGKEQLRAAALQAVAQIVGAEGGDAKSVEQLYFTSFVMQ